jgi:glycosyltransferase involved in cell wall biosynthesis
MKILILHNQYQIAGGEDGVVHIEKALLEAYGHSVSLLEVNNDSINSLLDKAKTAFGTIYSYASERLVSRAIAKFSPDIVHVHNFFPKLSPSVYFACKKLNVPVVQTLHNYRLFCATYSFYRDGKVCEDCLHKTFPWPGIVHGCYRGSKVGTAAVATMQFTHRIFGTWNKLVDCYITPTEFVRQKFIEAGLPESKLFVKPNFLAPDPGCGQGTGGYALFVGRLSPEKGIDTLLRAWQRIGKKMPLKIVGEGPLTNQVVAASDASESIEWLGKLPKSEVIALMKDAHLLIFPSLWDEVFGLVVVEAYAVGLPVIASNIGSLSSLIKHQKTGLHFRPGDAKDLADQVFWVLNHTDEVSSMKAAARKEFENQYTAEENYKILMNTYTKVLQNREFSS